ncbi:MAG: hypothetical protein IT258_02335 [Saprospiraceae bacterium]|nr:hypothetical protein [Saprospiraceae bacterium]
MFVIKANLTFVNVYRSKPLAPPFYRPLLFFSDKLIRSSEIPIAENEALNLDCTYDQRIVKIPVYKDILIEKEFFVGRNFIMKEGATAVVGFGEITEILGECRDDF